MILTPSGPAAPASGNDLDRRRWRLYVLAAALAGFAAVLVARLVFLQVIQHQRYAGMATEEHWRRSVIPPRRGDILDANGIPLATTVTYATLYATTSQIRDPRGVAARLAPILGASPADLTARLSTTQAAPVLLQTGLTDDVATRVERLGVDGLFVQTEPERVYPQGHLADQVLGAVGVDGNGLSGLELQYDQDLGGKPGVVVAERDTGGDTIPFGARLDTAPVDGATLTLTIDRYVQWVAERELDVAMAQHQAKAGVVVVVDPRSGAILALAGRPTFHNDNPRRFDRGSVGMFDVPAVAYTAEPGSIFKVVTLAAALDRGAVTPDTTFFDSGRFDYAGGTIHNAIARPAAPETVTQVLVYSSNVGAAWIATRLGAPAFYQGVRAFGIGQPTGVDLPGEASGLVRSPTAPDWSAFDLATNAFGQGLAASPLQMAVAMATVANGGVRMKPFVVRTVEGPAVHRQFSPIVAEQVISPATAAMLTRMLVEDVDDTTLGESRRARVPGYAIAGKTGTAQVPTPNGYSDSATIASFLGFGPADDPHFAILVQIDEPKDSPWGEAVAAPVFSAIARQLFSYYQIPPGRPVPTNGM